MDMKTKIEEAIAKADLVLVGIGEEFACSVQQMKAIPTYTDLIVQIEKDKERLNWLTPFLMKDYIEKYRNQPVEDAYEILNSLLQNKNYFIVTENMDGEIFHSSLNSERIVEPCGNYKYLQCEDNCMKELLPADELAEEIIAACVNGEYPLEQVVQPVCAHCGKKLVFNNVKASVYEESEYLPMWNKYMKWLQGTLNKNLCILELGVGFRYPTIIRWPFEKIGFLNQKADFFRVHHSLYQLSEELSGKGISREENAVDFLRNIFVQ